MWMEFGFTDPRGVFNYETKRNVPFLIPVYEVAVPERICATDLAEELTPTASSLKTHRYRLAQLTGYPGQVYARDITA